MREHRARFDATFEKAAHNITEPGEPAVIEAIRYDRDEYYQLYDSFLADMRAPRADNTPSANAQTEATIGRNEYFTKLEPVFNRLRVRCDDLLRLNQQAMLAKSAAAAGVARRWFLTTLLIAGMLVVAGLALAVLLSNMIVLPLRQLTAMMARIAGGDLDAEGRLLGAVMLLEDITHLREIDQMKSDFIVTASHELRTPLTSVQMAVHLLLEGAAGELTNKQQELLEVCRADCERLERLMRDLLDISKLESGESAPQLMPSRAANLINAAAGELRPQVEAKGLKLLVDAAPDLPTVLADRAQIERVIANLVNNAIRHTSRGGEITIKAGARDAGVAVSVTDTGRGIPAEYLPRIFDKFVQVPNAPTSAASQFFLDDASRSPAQHLPMERRPAAARRATTPHEYRPRRVGDSRALG